MADELRGINTALAALDERRAGLLRRRSHLLGAWQAQRPPVRRPGAWGPPVPPGAPAPHGPRTGRETSPVAVQNVLLTLGGVLLAIAAIAFTVISWGHLGIGGRASVLALLTLAAMAVPTVLLRRSLGATAEVVACVGLVLLLLDAYAVRHTLLPGPAAADYAAGAIAVVGAVWGGYAAWTRPRPPAGRGLLLPAPVAVLLLQLPLPLWSIGEGSAYATAAALLVTAVLDGVLVAVAASRSALVVPRTAAVVAGGVIGGLGLLEAAGLCLHAPGTGAALRAAALVAGAGAFALTAAVRVLRGQPAEGADRTAPTVLGAVAGLSAQVACCGVLRTLAPGHWAWLACLACATALLAGARAAWRTGRWRPAVAGVAFSALAGHALVALWAAPPLALALFGPLHWGDAVWSGAPAGALASVGDADGLAALPFAVAAAAWIGASLALTALRHPLRPTWARDAALLCAVAAAGALPVACDLPFAVALGLRLLLAALLLAAGVLVPTRLRPPTSARPSGHPSFAFPRWTPGTGTPSDPGAVRTDDGAGVGGGRRGQGAGSDGGAAGAGRAGFRGVAFWSAVPVAGTAAGWSLAERGATVAVMAVLTVLFGAASWRPRVGETRVVAPVLAVVSAASLAVAAPLAAGWAAHEASYAVLGVAALAQLWAWRGAGRAVEYAGVGAGALAVGFAVPDLTTLALVLGLAGVVTMAVALRADRRPWASYAAAALWIAASWVRLAASHVAVPEAYTLPLTVAALGVGWLRRRRDPEATSWGAYGAGLSATLVPSLVAAWDDAHWTRPLLLGAGALAVTLLGARHRLQAPLLLGGGVLALDALHELAPYVLQAFGYLPRWLPLALVGAVLLALGATYEHRLRDLRRVRHALGRLR